VLFLLRCSPSSPLFFLYTDTALTYISPLSLHDALPISAAAGISSAGSGGHPAVDGQRGGHELFPAHRPGRSGHDHTIADQRRWRSEEHTSELQSRVDLVCRLLLEKKKKKRQQL